LIWSGFLVWLDEARARRDAERLHTPLSAVHMDQLRSIAGAVLDSVVRFQLPAWSTPGLGLSSEQARRAFEPHFPSTSKRLQAYELAVRNREQDVWDLVKRGGDSLDQRFSPDPSNGIRVRENVSVVASFWDVRALQLSFKEHVTGQAIGTLVPFQSVNVRTDSGVISWEHLAANGGRVVGGSGWTDEDLEIRQAELQAWCDDMKDWAEVGRLVEARRSVYDQSLELNVELQDLRVRERILGACWICKVPDDDYLFPVDRRSGDI
jgi:hypothetical protein